MMKMQSIFYPPTPPAPVLLMSMCTLQSGGECMILPFMLAEDMPLSCFQSSRWGTYIPLGK